MNLLNAQIGRNWASIQSVTRILIAGVVLVGCLWGIWFSIHDGISALLSNYAVSSKLPAAAEEAIRFNPQDPEAHYARATVLKEKGELSEAVREYEMAAALRPQDYLLWLQLARARDQVEDAEGAVAASRMAVSLAPYYAEPHWQLGNLLFRMNRRDEGLVELRLAAGSQPSLYLNLIDLAWNALNGNTEAVIKVVNPQTARQRLELVRFLIKVGKTTEALTLFQAGASDFTESDRRDLLSLLLTQKQYPEAYELWKTLRSGRATGTAINKASIDNGSFEEEIALDESGFGWNLARELKIVHYAQDPSDPQAGAYSLRIEYDGDSGTVPVLSQLILVEPNARYHLTFAARTQEITSGSLPALIVSDATSGQGNVLGQSSPVARGSSGWKNYSVEFTTTGMIRAVRLSLQRPNCGSPVCPIFGRVWLDDFSIKKSP